jgi:hypothetical protein
VLVVSQVAIAVAALPAAANLGWSQIAGATTRPVYAADEFLVAPIRPELATDADTATAAADSARFGEQVDEVLRRLEAEPMVASATYSTSAPIGIRYIEVEGVPNPEQSPYGHLIAPKGIAEDWLAVYGARLLAGRGFQPADLAPHATAVVVNETFVRQVLGGASALGRRFRYARAGRAATADTVARPWYEVVGVVADLQRNELDPSVVRAEILHPVAPAAVRAATLEVRVRGGATKDVATRMREIVAAVDPTLRLGQASTLDDLEHQSRLVVRVVGLAIGLILVSVFLLSAGGIYALTSFTVTRRRREIGIRSALGAHPRQVLRAVFARVARQIALGLAIGLGAAALGDRLGGGELFGDKAGILLPAFGVAMTVVALLAAVGPARRGLRIQPSEALRAEA